MSGRNIVRAMRENGSTGKPGAPGNSIDTMLFALAIAAVLGAVIAGGWYFSRQAAPPPSAAPAARVAEPGWTAADTAACEQASRQTAAKAAAEQFLMANQAITDGGFAMLASRVACRASVRIARLCNGAEKAELVAMINDYAMRHDLVVAGLSLQGAFIDIMGGMLGGEAEGGSGVYDIVKKDTLGYMAVFHDRVVENLHALAEAGVLTSTDLGFFGIGLSGSLAPAFEKVTVARSICA